MSTRSRRLRFVAPAALAASLLATACGGDGARQSDGIVGSDGAAATSTTASALPNGSVVVVEVVDGDTLVVEFADESEDRVRIIGINAPESDECFADEAAKRLRDLVGDDIVELEVDVSDRDQFDRLLRHVAVDGTDVGLALVEEGYALARRFPPDVTRSDELEAAQEEAEQNGRGLWADDACGPPAPAADDLAIGAIRFDADGDDSENLNDEWIEIVNNGDETIALHGWTVRDESSSNRFEFPTDFELDPGATVRLHGGCGDATQQALFWCASGSAIWNNDGDTVFLLDPNGTIAVSRRG